MSLDSSIHLDWGMNAISSFSDVVIEDTSRKKKQKRKIRRRKMMMIE